MNYGDSLTKKIYGRTTRKKEAVETMRCENCGKQVRVKDTRLCFTTKGKLKICEKCYYQYNKNNKLP